MTTNKEISAYCTYPECSCSAPHASDKFKPKSATKQSECVPTCSSKCNVTAENYRPEAKPTKMGPFEKIGGGVGRLVEEKQAAYGDSFGKAGDIMRILYPEGVSLDKLDDALTVVRVLDKLFRIATRKNAFGESPWRDIAGYSLLAIRKDEENPKQADSREGLNGLGP